MKKMIFLMMAVCFGLQSFANKFTLNNTPGAPADFTNSADAIAGVLDGDTIYVQPSATSYGNITIDKRIVLLGAGHNPEFTTYRCEFSGILFASGSGESVIKGLFVSNLVSVLSYANVPNVVMSNNYFSGQNVMNTEIWATAPGWVIEGNVIYSSSNWLSIPGFSDATVFRNNLFCHVSSSLFYGVSPGVTFDHNTFIFVSGSVVENTCINCNSANFINNIFYISAPSTGNLHGSCTSCIWENNITFSVNGVINSLPGTNYNNEDPLFVNVPSATPNFLYTNDYSLTALSPAVNAATDGTDVGLTGGITEFGKFGFDPSLPRLKEVQLLQNYAPVNGTISIHVHGVASGN